MRIRMLEDDIEGGFKAGDKFEVKDDYFVDNDGDKRRLGVWKYEVINDPLKIEAGKRYVRCDGTVSGCLVEIGVDSHPFTYSDGFNLYTNNGRFWGDKFESEYDLIREYVDEGEYDVIDSADERAADALEKAIHEKELERRAREAAMDSTTRQNHYTPPSESYNITRSTKYLLRVFERSWAHDTKENAETQARGLVRNGTPIEAIGLVPLGDAVPLSVVFDLDK